MSFKEVKIKSSDDKGVFSAFISFPEKTPAPAVVVIQEIFGVNAVMRGICEDLSKQGYVAICPDLFWRQEPGIQLTDRTKEEWDRAFQLYQGFDVNSGVEDLKSTLAFIRRDEACTGSAGTMGFCLGGALAYLMATRSDSDCNVSYYGVGIQDLLAEAGNIAKPLLMHIAEKDKFVPSAAQEKILGTLGEKPGIDLRVYLGVDHALARNGGEHYDKDSADEANRATAEFLKNNLVRAVSAKAAG